MNIELFKYFFDENVIIFACFGLATIMTIISFNGSKFKSLAPELAVQFINDGAKLVDLRETTDYRHATITGAVNIPLSDVNANISDITNKLNKSKSVILFCNTGIQSQQIQKRLKKQGCSAEIYSLQGGIKGWKDANFPTARHAKKRKSKS